MLMPDVCLLNNHCLLRVELFIIHISETINGENERRDDTQVVSLFINKQSGLSLVCAVL